MYTQQLKFSSQKTLLSVQNRPLMWFLVLPFAYFSCLEALGLKVTNIPHSPQSRCLSMLVSLDTCGEGGKLWDQGPKMRVWASYSFLKNVSYVCPSAAVSTLLAARFYISGPLSFSSHLYSVLLLCNRPPQIEWRVHYRLRMQVAGKGTSFPWWGSERLYERRCPETTSRLSWLTSHAGSNSPRGKFRHHWQWLLTLESDPLEFGCTLSCSPALWPWTVYFTFPGSSH